MRKEAEITIDKRVYKIFEIRPKDILDVYHTAKTWDGGADDNAFLKIAVDNLLPLLTDASKDELIKMWPSDQELMFEKLKEVNQAFLKRLTGIMRRPEVKEITQPLIKSFMTEYGATFANLFNQDTGSQNDTGGPSL